ncbi:MAG: hypothetical protein J7623_19675 [Chitinophaga sp.]|uniref:hypothetical protein n=1 Tax=Chitinophaga sp. TaxID=1869181 RepID=UPI001B233E15|nr:hypothetical protein [Chitinophaga sp.]MBO9730869.1 hypothetical protein [Chitinophaga sp.]
MKWIFYCLNYDHLARHIIYETAAITPVKCDPVIWEIKRRKDTTIYYFSSYYQSPSEQYWMVPDEFVGIATIGGRPRYTVGGHFSLEKPETTEEANIFFLHRDSLFTHYIRQYKGEINEWLKAELIRRGITPNYKQQNIWLSLTGNF